MKYVVFVLDTFFINMFTLMQQCAAFSATVNVAGLAGWVDLAALRTSFQGLAGKLGYKDVALERECAVRAQGTQALRERKVTADAVTYDMPSGLALRKRTSPKAL